MSCETKDTPSSHHLGYTAGWEGLPRDLSVSGTDGGRHGTLKRSRSGQAKQSAGGDNHCQLFIRPWSGADEWSHHVVVVTAAFDLGRCYTVETHV